ncbi:MAG: xanthine dehydrogenase family protein molybdopterin-binding subunit [Armatimonadaceae bacterium]
MSDKWTDLDSLSFEPERYELSETPAYRFAVTRRHLFQTLGGGLLVFLLTGAAGDDAEAQQESGVGGRRSGQNSGQDRETQTIAAWLHVGEDGTVRVYTGKVEVGQNARTALTQAVAEELPVALTSIQMVMADTDLVPYDAGTFGSRTTPNMNPQLRKAASAAREALLQMAAEKWNVPRGELVMANGTITHAASRRSLGIGELTKGQKLLKTIGDDIALTPAEKWNISGKSLAKVNGRDIVTGKHAYTSDITRPGMLYGNVVRPESFGATLTSAEIGEAQKMPGVMTVRDGDFLAVAAPTSTQAEDAAGKVSATWQVKPQVPGDALFEHLKATGESGGGRGDFQKGDVSEGLAAAAHRVSQVYNIAYIAHAPLEPRAAVAEWENGKLTVWTGTQRPFGVRSELANAFQIPEERVRVIVPDTGSGYGGKHTGDAAIEAARLAKAAGKPVKVVWSREEEFTWAYFRPAGVIEIISGVSADGKVTAWEHHNYNSGGSGIRTEYDVPHQKIQFHRSDSPLRQGSYRALAATANQFAREVHMDEMAHLVKMDPLTFRLQNTTNDRFRAVLEAAAAAFGWGKSAPETGRGYGLAVGTEKGGFVANCVEVGTGTRPGEYKVLRVVTAFECGAIVNPDQLKNQVEGGIIQGLGGALFEAVDFAEGKIRNPRFSEYRVPRFRDLPVLETVLLDRKDLPSAGAGESPLVALAPAIGNALFAATGVRLRALPLIPNGLPR